jgi:hypothetical protein
MNNRARRYSGIRFDNPSFFRRREEEQRMRREGLKNLLKQNELEEDIEPDNEPEEEMPRLSQRPHPEIKGFVE